MNSFLGNKHYILNKYIRAIDFFNEADTLESSSILIYSKLHTGLDTQ
jgi:hypothetical protein